MRMTHVLVATPSYQHMVSGAYLHSLMQYSHAPEMPKFSYDIVSGDSLVTRARNMLFTRYVQAREVSGYTHIFWQDDDIAIEGPGLGHIVSLDLDVVAIAYPLKTDERIWGIPCVVLGVYEQVDRYLYKAKFAGTGALLMSNRAVSAVVDHCEAHGLFYFTEEGGDKIYDVFQVGARDGMYYSEDWHLCRLLRELGFEIHVDSSSSCAHFAGVRGHVRPALEIDPRAIRRTDLTPLPVEARDTYWTPNDVGAAYADQPY
ncbi:MAG: hypothetical protein WC005_08500 [Candidatus Nanopelagicales bacterium]